MRRLVILVSVAVVAAGSAACGNSPDGSTSAIFGPSPSAITTEAKGGNGGKGPGGGGTTGGGGSIALVMYTDLNLNGLPNWGDTVTWNVSTTATTEPHVDLNCSQNGTLVYTGTTGLFASYPWPWTKNMTLSSGVWTGGAANCTATLYYFGSRSNVVLATQSFNVGA